jgi:hypothetical protein
MDRRRMTKNIRAVVVVSTVRHGSRARADIWTGEDGEGTMKDPHGGFMRLGLPNGARRERAAITVVLPSTTAAPNRKAMSTPDRKSSTIAHGEAGDGRALPSLVIRESQ